MTFWEENGSIVMEMWSEGRSGSEIAAHFGITRDAVLGYLRRNGRLRTARKKLDAHLRGPRLPPRSFRWSVVEVNPALGTFSEVGKFATEKEAQISANEAGGIEGSFRLIYNHSRFWGGVCWKAMSNEEWLEARQLVARLSAKSVDSGAEAENDK